MGLIRLFGNLENQRRVLSKVAKKPFKANTKKRNNGKIFVFHSFIVFFCNNSDRHLMTINFPFP